MRKTEEDQGTRLIRYTLSVLLGGAVALLLCFLMLLLAAFAISQGWLDAHFIAQLAIVACVLGAFGGAVAAVRRARARALIVGVAVGAVLFLFLLTVGVLFFDTMAPEAGGIGLLCGSLCGGAAAGLLGSRQSKQKKKHRK